MKLEVMNCDERYEAAKAAGVELLMPPTEMDYGETSFGFNDHWGNQWWLATYTGGAC